MIKKALFLALCIAPLSATLAQSSIQPCGGGSNGTLWAWAWAGANGEFVTTQMGNFGKPIIRQFQDLSGNGNHFFNNEGGRPSQPGYQVGLSLGGWSTSLPVIGLSSYADGTRIYGQLMFQNASMDANAFYLAAAVANTRQAGNRWLFGVDSNDYVKLDQGQNFVRVKIGGQGEITLTGNGSLDGGPVLVEVWRDAAGNLRGYVNGTDKTLGNPQSTATFRMSGVGGPYDRGSDPGPADSAWDDHAFEYIACKGVTSSAQRAAVREYLRSKWTLFGASTQTPIPQPPSNLSAQ